MAIAANLECGSLLPLSARLLAGALWAGSKQPAQKAGASSRTPYRHDFDVPLGRKGGALQAAGKPSLQYPRRGSRKGDAETSYRSLFSNAVTRPYMRIKSLPYAACHEAGHAVVAFIHGYEISEINLWQSDHSIGWEGETNYKPQEWKCPLCGTEIQRHDPVCLKSLKDDCPSCKEEKFKFIERCFAGGAATSGLGHPEHDNRDSEDDRGKVGALYVPHSKERLEAFDVGNAGAQEKMRQYKKPVISLQNELVKNAKSTNSLGGREVTMAGDEVMRIISGSLNATEATSNVSL